MIEHINIPEERMIKLGMVKDWKKRLEELLEVIVSISEDISIEGNPIQVMRGKEIIKAFGRGLSFEESLDLLDEDYYLDIIDVKDFAGKSKDRQITMKGRIIGEGGKTKKLIEKNAGVKVAVYGKTVSIIGKVENIRIARLAIEMILSGSKHNTVYRFLQDNKVI